MSRNLCKTDCDRCGGEVTLTGPTAPITPEQTGVYFDEYEGMLVADAECTICCARYLAWVNETTRKNRAYAHFYRHPTEERGFVDLSYRAAFNDEPADEDVPPWIKPAELRSRLATIEAERDKLRMFWESVDERLKGLRAHEASKGGQTVGPPEWLTLLKVPSVRRDLEWLAREALAPATPGVASPPLQPTDPVERVLAVECPLHGKRACSVADGPKQDGTDIIAAFCSCRIRRALATPPIPEKERT